MSPFTATAPFITGAPSEAEEWFWSQNAAALIVPKTCSTVE